MGSLKESLRRRVTCNSRKLLPELEKNALALHGSVSLTAGGTRGPLDVDS